MKKRNILLVVLGFIVLFTLTGCGNKTVKATSDFKSIAESKGYTVSDVTSQYSSYPDVTEATVAQSSSGYQLEFYVLDEIENAKNMFETNRETFDQNKGSNYSHSEVNLGNYSTYSLTNDGYYMYLSRVENTLLYVRVPKSYKDDIKGFVKELGY